MLVVPGPGQVKKLPTLLSFKSSPCWFLPNPGGWGTPGAKGLTPSLGWGRPRIKNPSWAVTNPRSNPHGGNLGAPNLAPSLGWVQFVGCKGCCPGPCVFCLAHKGLNFDFLSDHFPCTCLAIKIKLVGFFAPRDGGTILIGQSAEGKFWCSKWMEQLVLKCLKITKK